MQSDCQCCSGPYVRLCFYARASSILLIALSYAFFLLEVAHADDCQTVVRFVQQPIVGEEPPGRPDPPASTDATPLSVPSPPEPLGTVPIERPEPLATDPFAGWGLFRGSSSSLRLASVPNMLGDYFGSIKVIEYGNAGSAKASVPLAGGIRRMKISENNKPLPMNRCYVMYHHFHNALATDPGIGSPSDARDASVDRYTLGIERTVLNESWSVDLRMPWVVPYSASMPGFSVEGGEVGNLSVSVKHLLRAGERGALSAGFGIETPTGSDVTAQLGGNSLTIHNDAVVLQPYLGLLLAPGDLCFFQGFLQLDLPTNGNRVVIDSPFPGTTMGILTDQSMMHLDLSAGIWLHRVPGDPILPGLAFVSELHYATTLGDADLLQDAVGGNAVLVGNTLGRLDITNASVGLHFELPARTTLRIAGVFPLQSDEQRPFDAEAQLSLNRYY